MNAFSRGRCWRICRALGFGRAHRHLFLALLVGSLLGCSDSAGKHPSVARAFQALDEAPVDAPLARVNTRAISQAELRDYMTTSARLADGGDAPQDAAESEPAAPSPGEALERLNDREVLVAEAIRRGYLERADLQDVRKRAMVRQLLAEQVEELVHESDLTEDEIANAIEAVQAEVGHPPGLQASHILVSVPLDKQKDASREQIDEWFNLAMDQLELLRDALPAAPSAYQLFEARDRLRDQLPEPLEVHVNAHLLFPIGDFLTDAEKPTRVFGTTLPQTWRSVVEPFGRAAADMARKGRFGELSDPVKTDFGWHLIVVEKALPAKVGDPAQIREVAVESLLRRRRHARLVEQMNAWTDAASVYLYPEVLAAAEEMKQ